MTRLSLRLTWSVLLHYLLRELTECRQHAHAVENLLPFLRPGSRVLDVGSGSGYLVALFHHLVSGDPGKGKVVGIEHIPQLVDWSVTNLKRDGLEKALEDDEIVMFSGDGRQGRCRNYCSTDD